MIQKKHIGQPRISEESALIEIVETKYPPVGWSSEQMFEYDVIISRQSRGGAETCCVGLGTTN